MSRHRSQEGVRYRNRRRGGPGERRRMAVVFAIALGWCGVHRFTLGQWQWGLFHIFLFVVSMATLSDWVPFDMTPWTTVSAFLAYYQAYKWWKMSDEEFGEQFLESIDEPKRPVIGKYLEGTEVIHPRVLSGRAKRQLLASAKTSYEEFDFQAAAERYEQALDLDLSDGESRVLAARCYSLLEDAEAAYRHLARAVKLEASNLALVGTDPDFAWLRTQEDFSTRQRNGYWVAQENGRPSPPELAAPHPSLLDDLERLARLREQGILNEVEFAREKERLLRH